MTDHDELIERLDELANYGGDSPWAACKEAATALRSLVAENERLQKIVAIVDIEPGDAFDNLLQAEARLREVEERLERVTDDRKLRDILREEAWQGRWNVQGCARNDFIWHTAQVIAALLLSDTPSETP